MILAACSSIAPSSELREKLATSSYKWLCLDKASVGLYQALKPNASHSQGNDIDEVSGSNQEDVAL
jgi:hypothetical protein